MLIDKPDWVSHEGLNSPCPCMLHMLCCALFPGSHSCKLHPLLAARMHPHSPTGSPIHSVDIDSAGERLVTAGGDKKVRVWALRCVLHEQSELDPASPKVLATLSEHYGTVHAARFSKSGKLIASASDDKQVIIYQLQPGQGKSVFGSKDAPNLENWRVLHSLKGHSSDVMDVAWCPTGAMLASASLDNRVIVWDVAKGHVVKTLEGHEGWVKGVAWDPHNSYLASQGERDGVCIWRVGTWALVKRVQGPWANVTATSAMHTRLDWSPDGQSLVATNAFDKPTHQAPLIKRNTWTSENQLVGHKQPVQVVKHSPKFYLARDVSGRWEGVCV